MKAQMFYRFNNGMTVKVYKIILTKKKNDVHGLVWIGINNSTKLTCRALRSTSAGTPYFNINGGGKVWINSCDGSDEYLAKLMKGAA